MADQTSLKESRNNNGQGESVVSSLAELSNDIATLVELQAKLAALDFKEGAERAVWPLVVALGALALFVSSLPILLGGLALLIASVLSIPIGWAFLLTALVTMIVAGAAAAIAGSRFSASLETFRRSREELVRNISWIRTVLVHGGRAAPRRRW